MRSGLAPACCLLSRALQQNFALFAAIYSSRAISLTALNIGSNALSRFSFTHVSLFSRTLSRSKVIPNTSVYDLGSDARSHSSLFLVAFVSEASVRAERFSIRLFTVSILTQIFVLLLPQCPVFSHQQTAFYVYCNFRSMQMYYSSTTYDSRFATSNKYLLSPRFLLSLLNLFAIASACFFLSAFSLTYLHFTSVFINCSALSLPIIHRFNQDRWCSSLVMIYIPVPVNISSFQPVPPQQFLGPSPPPTA